MIKDYIVSLCDFAEDSMMIKYINQEGWTKIHHVTSIGIHEVKDFHTRNNDGFYEATLLMMHFYVCLKASSYTIDNIVMISAQQFLSMAS